MKILVIGASSFTGRNFCDYAREKGAEVVEASLRDLKKLSMLLMEPQEYIVNFAALNVVSPSWKYPSDYLFTNVYALTSIIDLLKDKPLKKFVQISTPEVLGSNDNWLKEDACYNPSTPYGVSKAAAEMMLKVYAREMGFPICITRSCNVYGTHQQLYRLLPKIIAYVKGGKRFPLEGSGKSSRAFIHVTDCVDAIWRVMTDGMLGNTYHISTRELQPIHAIVKHVCDKFKVKFDSAVELVPERIGKDMYYMLDSGRIRAELDWQDTVSFDRGLDEMIAWIEKDWDAVSQSSFDYEHRP